MAYCSKCGTQLNEGAKFCPRCGTSTESQQRIGRSIVQNKSSIPNESEEENLTTMQKIALGVGSVFAFIGLCGGAISATDGVWSILIVSILSSAAIFCTFIGVIDRKYAWATAIGSFIAIFIAIGTSESNNKERGTTSREKHFYKMLPSNGSATFIVEDCKPIGDEGLIIKSIEFFEKNDTRDFRLEGFLKNGNTVEYEGKWSEDKQTATFQGKEYKYYKFWCTGFSNYNFYVDTSDYLYCSFAFWDNDKDVGKAFQAGALGKMKVANAEDVERAAAAAKMEAEKRQAQFVGDYYYSFFIQNTNASLYFKISLKSDGTFTHGPSNETTKNYIDMESIVDGKNYPTGGTWSATDNGITLNFNGNWSGGKISADMKRLEIFNMNGYDLKTPLSK